MNNPNGKINEVLEQAAQARSDFLEALVRNAILAGKELGYWLCDRDYAEAIREWQERKRK